MKHIRCSKQIALLAITLLLTACGGGESNNDKAPITPASACTGAVQELFVAMQGSYDGLADPAFASGAALPLTPGKVYPVMISGKECAIRFTGNNDVKYNFIYGEPGNKAASKLTGFSGTTIIKNPVTLNLTENQYNISIATSNNTIELERRVKSISGAEVTDGDLHLYSIPGPASFGGMQLRAASKR
ncbi:hypothetical protein [Chitinibacter sp. GC72]|uniref:hypothetical protein n=1 Tax=Chitinibacter sp. GC72 TaxID=1526917 RepID=UPI0012FB9531|nr:hypothetical protein [Chitinibacter sp. GC72]